MTLNPSFFIVSVNAAKQYDTLDLASNTYDIRIDIQTYPDMTTFIMRRSNVKTSNQLTVRDYVTRHTQHVLA